MVVMVCAGTARLAHRTNKSSFETVKARLSQAVRAPREYG
jgi:hypothetical protein